MRKFFRSGLLALLLAAPALCSWAKDPVDYVDPLIGTDGGIDPSLFYGGMIPAVMKPFAMIQWSPMTRLNRIARVCYRHGDNAIIGFIGTRQPTIWMGDYGNLSIMPGIGEVRHGFEERKLKFRHRDETSTPYYYSVNAGKIRTELTADMRSAILRISFPAAAKPFFVVDASRAAGFSGWVEIQPEKNRIIGCNTDRLSAHLGPPLPNFKGWFVVEFDRPFLEHGTYNGPARNPDKMTEQGESIGAYAVFAGGDVRPLMVKIGTSLISLEQAGDNLEREIPDWDFERVKSSARAAWNEQLSRILVEGGSEDQKHVFYTAMYHSHQFPREFSEYGRYYSAFDDQIHQGVSYNDYSMWDTFRAEHPLLILTATERVADMVTSLLQMYEEGGWLPKWPNPTYTGIMTGTHSDSIIAEAWVKGIRGFDLAKAYEAVRKNAFVPPEGDQYKRWEDRAPWTSVESRAGLTWYMKYGYVPLDKTAESVTNTLEYAYDDFCAAQLAKSLGLEDDYRILMGRSQNYRKLFRDGFMEARLSDGSWAGKTGYTESTKWGYMFFAPQDIPGLIRLYGGDQAFEKALDKMFAPGLRLYRYIHMNEPQHNYIYLYNYCGAAWKTQQQARRIMAHYYFNSPAGLLGTDDCGQMSAWYIFSSLGFYPVTPGTDVYALGSPLWDKATISLGAPYPKSTFKVIAKNQAPGNIYVQSATLNGKPLTGPFIRHSDILAGGELILVMGPQPNRGWGKSGPE